MKTFKDLDTWKQAHILVIQIYNLTRIFPESEKFGLTNQIRRCVVSITSNLAEGYGRPLNKEKLRFYSIALGSLNELQNQLLISNDVGFIADDVFESVEQQLVRTRMLLSGLMRSIPL